ADNAPSKPGPSWPRMAACAANTPSAVLHVRNATRAGLRVTPAGMDLEAGPSCRAGDRHRRDDAGTAYLAHHLRLANSRIDGSCTADGRPAERRRGLQPRLAAFDGAAKAVSCRLSPGPLRRAPGTDAGRCYTIVGVSRGRASAGEGRGTDDHLVES